jgi:hypothetical protein
MIFKTGVDGEIDVRQWITFRKFLLDVLTWIGSCFVRASLPVLQRVKKNFNIVLVPY